jgi:hypothetical protein
MAGGTSVAGNLLADQLGVTDLGGTGFEILGDLVVISGDMTEQGF